MARSMADLRHQMDRFDALPRGYRKAVSRHGIAVGSWKTMRVFTVAQLERYFEDQCNELTDEKLRSAGIEPPKRTRPSRI